MIFILSAFWWMRLRGFWVSWWKGLPGGKGGSCSVGSVNLWTNFLFLPCSFVWGQTIVGVIVTTVTFFKRTWASTLRLPGLLCSVPLTLQQATFDPHLCLRLLEPHRLVWLRLNIILNYYRYPFNIFYWIHIVIPTRQNAFPWVQILIHFTYKLVHGRYAPQVVICMNKNIF